MKTQSAQKDLIKSCVAHPFKGVRGCQKDFPSVPFGLEPKIDLLLVISLNFNCPGQLDR